MPNQAASEGFGNLVRSANKLMDQMQKGFVVYSPETWTPNVNLYEARGSYYVCVDLAGVEKEKIDVEVAESRLVLRGSRPVPSPQLPPDAEPAPPAASQPAMPVHSGSPPPSSDSETDHHRRVKLHLMEIDHGAFTREVELPSDANSESITATYRNGMLWVEIPKK